MVVVTMLPHVAFGRNDHQKDARHFTLPLYIELNPFQVNDVEKLLVKHGTEMNIKVEDAIARAQTPAPMLNPEEENLRQQVFLFIDH